MSIWIKMRSWFRNTRPAITRRPVQRQAHLVVDALEDRLVLNAGAFVQTNLVSDIPGMAQSTDPNLQNPWGLTASATSPFWVSDNNAGASTVYSGQGAIVPLVVTIPTNTSTVPPTLGSPTGIAANTAGKGFFQVSSGKPSAFLFDTEDGNVDAWGGGMAATVEYDNPSAGYKGLTLGTDAAGDNLLYAANFAQGTVDVFDSSFNLVEGALGGNAMPSSVKLAGKFTDSHLPRGYAPFNIQNIGGELYVEYALYDTKTTEGAPGAGRGYVDVYNGDGVLQKRLISGGPLNAPWGITLAPADFGSFSGDLLVGNFGDGRINAFNPATGHFLGSMQLADGQPFQEDNLWAIEFGNGAVDKSTGDVTAPTNSLYFTAGINEQKDGLFGSLQAVPTIAKGAPLLDDLPNAPVQSISTVPANGDVNPYGVAFVPQDFNSPGVLQRGDVLVSNFNDGSNTQGTGTTIVRISPDGQQSVFFQGAPGLGLTTALGVLQSGFVLVGSVPAVNGVAQQGSLLVLNANGKLVMTLTDSSLLDSPWDLAINDQGSHAQVFVSNVLSGTVTRIDLTIPRSGTPKVESETQIASGYGTATSMAALVLGPTGLAYDAKTDTLYVASTDDNAIFAIHNASSTNHDHGTGQLIYDDPNYLHGPLGLVLAPNGNLIIANGDAQNENDNDANELVEITKNGKFVDKFQLDSGGPGAAFGIAITNDDGVLRFAAVDDDSNTVQIWTLQDGNL